MPCRSAFSRSGRTAAASGGAGAASTTPSYAVGAGRGPHQLADRRPLVHPRQWAARHGQHGVDGVAHPQRPPRGCRRGLSRWSGVACCRARSASASTTASGVRSSWAISSVSRRSAESESTIRSSIRSRVRPRWAISSPPAPGVEAGGRVVLAPVVGQVGHRLHLAQRAAGGHPGGGVATPTVATAEQHREPDRVALGALVGLVVLGGHDGARPARRSRTGTGEVSDRRRRSSLRSVGRCRPGSSTYVPARAGGGGRPRGAPSCVEDPDVLVEQRRPAARGSGLPSRAGRPRSRPPRRPWHRAGTGPPRRCFAPARPGRRPRGAPAVRVETSSAVAAIRARSEGGLTAIGSRPRARC